MVVSISTNERFWLISFSVHMLAFLLCHMVTAFLVTAFVAAIATMIHAWNGQSYHLMVKITVGRCLPGVSCATIWLPRKC